MSLGHMFRKLSLLFLLGLFLIPSITLMTNARDFKSTNYDITNNSPSIVPLTIQSIINYSVEVKFEDSFTSLMNSDSNFFVFTVFGSSVSGLYDAVVLLGNSSGNAFIDYSFASDIMTDPLTFTGGNLDMIQSYNDVIQVTFAQYAVYKTYPVIVSSLAVFSTETVLQIEADFPLYANNYFKSYFSSNDVSGQPSSTNVATSSASSSTSKSRSIGFNFLLPIVVFPFIYLYLKKRKF